MDEKRISAIVLAAGKGTRMKTPIPKVLHPVAGVPMLIRVIRSLKASGVSDIRVIVGHGEKLVRERVEPLGVNCYLQSEQLGTAHAVSCGDLSTVGDEVLIVNGDHPLISGADFEQILAKFHEQNLDLGVCSAVVKKPGQFGRIVRHHGVLHSIVEAKDASAETLKINEINTGLYVVDGDLLRNAIEQVSANNASAEYYLTDIVEIAREQGCQVDAIRSPQRVGFGVNDQRQLATATKMAYRKKVLDCMDNGVIVLSPETTWIEDSVTVESSAVLGPCVQLKGETAVAAGVVVDQGCVIIDSELGTATQVKAYSHLEEVKVGAECTIGPFARLRPQTELSQGVKIGNFVETKKATFGKGTKASHLTYIGDAIIGSEVNFGCGTITCNYAADRKKYQTIIGDGVFVGSDTQLVAPVEVGDNAVIGSGSTITKDVPARALAVSRAKQVNHEDYVKE